MEDIIVQSGFSKRNKTLLRRKLGEAHEHYGHGAQQS